MQWKDVVGFEDYFRISEFGDLWSKRSNKILKQNLHGNGYYTVATKIGGRYGKTYCFKIHRLVAEAFLEKPNEELVTLCSKQAHGVVIVRHIDNNKINNHYSNLLWGTYQDNTNDFIKSDGYEEYKKEWLTSQSGTSNCNASLSDIQIQYIKLNYKSFCKGFGARALAKLFGVHHSTISRVTRGLRYK